jgi:hypothetical protein
MHVPRFTRFDLQHKYMYLDECSYSLVVIAFGGCELACIDSQYIQRLHPTYAPSLVQLTLFISERSGK